MGLRPPKVMKNASVRATTLYGTVPSPLSSRRTRISYFTGLTGAAYVVLLKENHMQLTEAVILDRKSGEAEGSAVLRTFRGNRIRLQNELSSRLPRRARSAAQWIPAVSLISPSSQV
jgi:hypothetical protein